MIFVTVGTTLGFDALIRKMDQLVAAGEIADRVVCQTGPGAYLPAHCEHFRFTPDIDEWLDKASLIVGHGGTGTVSSLLALGKPFVAVANPAGAEDHQTAFLARLSRNIAFLWTGNLDELPELLRKAPSFEISAAGGERLADDLRAYLRAA